MSFSKAAFDSVLETQQLGRTVELLDETQSTMDDARAAAGRGVAEGFVVVAEQQRAGRGSHGRVWDSPKGEDLYFSLVLRPTRLGPELAQITLAAGLACARAVSSLLVPADIDERRVQIKWPNDVYIDGRKCVGILSETESRGERVAFVVLGMGINVGRRDFGEALSGEATSLALASPADTPPARETVLAKVLKELEITLSLLGLGPLRGTRPASAAALVDAIQRRLAFIDERVVCGETQGVLLGLSPMGGLRLRTPEGERTLMSGTLRRAQD